MKKIFYWAPFIDKVGTVKGVINSAYAVNKYLKKKSINATIIDAVQEWRDFYNDFKDKNIDLIQLNKKTIFKKISETITFDFFDKNHFFKSRLLYWYIFIKSFNPLHNLLKKEKPDYLIIHLITSLPLFLFILYNYETKLILRISGLPKLTFVRKCLWKIASKKIFKITCPTKDTFNDLCKYDFLKDKLCVLHDPILNIGDIELLKKDNPKTENEIKDIIENKKFFLSIGRFTKQKNFLFFLNSISEIINSNDDLYFIFIGEGGDKKFFIDTIRKLNLSKKVFTLSFTKNVHYFMRKSYALVLTSLWEDPGYVLIEAGYNNCLVISSDCPNGPSEIISKDGGYLFKSNSKNSFIEKINLFLNDKEIDKLNKKIKLKKRVKKFTLFYHSKILEQKIII